MHRINPTTEKMKLATYARVSTPEQASGVSPHDQIERGNECAFKNHFLEHEAITDIGFTGSLGYLDSHSKRKRPGLISLVNKVRSGVIQGVFVTSNDRLSRNVKVMLDLMTEFRENKIRLF